ncbi:MAG TPA: TRAP transporter large permease [Devosiaceae bacterium]|jgi:tripartite ATP-independent transporter DctM subunit
MTPLFIALFCFIGLFVLVLATVPIGIALTAVGLVGFAMQAGWPSAFTVLSGDPSALLSSPDFATVPLFVLMGACAGAAGFSADLYGAAAALIGHRRGGLAHATILGSAAFGSVCGSSPATAATFTKVALPEMLRRGYSPSFSAGTIAAGGTLKSLIPPSLLMIIYSLVAKTFILDLFLAALIPAILTIIFNLIAIWIMARWKPELAPTSPPLPWSERWQAIVKAGPALLLLVVVFGGLYSGIFTINEGASVAALLSIAAAFIRRRLTIKQLFDSLLESASVTVMLFIILFGAYVFSYALTLGQVPSTAVAAIGNLGVNPWELIILLLIFYLVLGTVFDELAAVIVTTPYVLPLVVAAGFDPIWWGVICVIQVELSLIHPPFGIIGFVIHRVDPRIPIRSVYKGVIPFIIADALVLVLLVLFPQLALWLPTAMRGF